MGFRVDKDTFPLFAPSFGCADPHDGFPPAWSQWSHSANGNIATKAGNLSRSSNRVISFEIGFIDLFGALSVPRVDMANWLKAFERSSDIAGRPPNMLKHAWTTNQLAYPVLNRLGYVELFQSVPRSSNTSSFVVHSSGAWASEFRLLTEPGRCTAHDKSLSTCVDKRSSSVLNSDFSFRWKGWSAQLRSCPLSTLAWRSCSLPGPSPLNQSL